MQPLCLGTPAEADGRLQTAQVQTKLGEDEAGAGTPLIPHLAGCYLAAMNLQLLGGFHTAPWLQGVFPAPLVRAGSLPRCNWTSFTSRVLDLRCRASWQAAVTTLSMKSSAICNSICHGRRTSTSPVSAEQLKPGGKHENEPSGANVSKAYATVAALKNLSQRREADTDGWSIQQRNVSQPPPTPGTKGHWAVKSPPSALCAAPARVWYLLPPRLHPAARLGPPHAPGPAASSWLKPEGVREERFAAPSAKRLPPRLPHRPEAPVLTQSISPQTAEIRHQVLRSHFRARAPALNRKQSAAAQEKQISCTVSWHRDTPGRSEAAGERTKARREVLKGKCKQHFSA